LARDRDLDNHHFQQLSPSPTIPPKLPHHPAQDHRMTKWFSIH
jgi:hypothetical protein